MGEHQDFTNCGHLSFIDGILQKLEMTTRQKEKRAANSRFAKALISCFYENEVLKIPAIA